jgi:hypothetical protein
MSEYDYSIALHLDVWHIYERDGTDVCGDPHPDHRGFGDHRDALEQISCLIDNDIERAGVRAMENRGA